MACKQQRDK